MGYFMFQRSVYTNRDPDSNEMATVPNGISVSMQYEHLHINFMQAILSVSVSVSVSVNVP